MNLTEDTVLHFKPGNPFAERAIRAYKLNLSLNRPTVHDEAMRNAFPLGAGFRHGSIRSGEKRIEASVNRASKAVQAKQNADYWIGRAEAFDRGEVNAQGRAINSEKMEKCKSDLNALILKTVKVGDMIDIGGNDLVRVEKVNAKSVITSGGCKWMASEIARVIPAQIESKTEVPNV